MSAPEPTTLSVIVATRNRRTSLLRCLAALSAQTRPGAEVIVVDDASDDGTLEAVRDTYPNACCLREDTRVGAAAARNRGLRVARGDLILFTDDDCVPPAQWLERHAAYYRDPRLGAVGGPQRVRSPDACERFDLAWYAAAQDRAYRFDEVAGQVGLYTSNMSVRREAVARAGGFDERFPRGEDSELARRIAGAGYRLMWDPALVVEHLKVHSLGSYLALWFRRGHGSAASDLKAGKLPARRFVPLPNVPRLLRVRRDHRTLFGGGPGSGLAFWGLAVAARWCEVAGRVHFCCTSGKAFGRGAD